MFDAKRAAQAAMRFCSLRHLPALKKLCAVIFVITSNKKTLHHEVVCNDKKQG